jgi:hypothetical protein
MSPAIECARTRSYCSFGPPAVKDFPVCAGAAEGPSKPEKNSLSAPPATETTKQATGRRQRATSDARRGRVPAYADSLTLGGITMRKVLLLALVAMAALLPTAGAMGETAADKAMANQIGRRLKESGQLRDYQIGIMFQDGVAWLDGTVTSVTQRDAAARLAREMNGVSHVVCRLEVMGAAAGRTEMAQAFSDSEVAAAGGGPSQVVQAAATNGRPRMSPSNTNGGGQRMPATAPNYAMANRPSPIPRNNMPMPAGRMANYPAMPAAGQNVQQAYQMPPADAAVMGGMGPGIGMAPAPTAYAPGGARAVNYDNAQLPGYAWPSYASYPNYAALTYPQQYSPTAWPYIGPFYPYPQVPLAWRKVSLEWDDGWWMLDFSAHNSSH